MSDAYLEGLQAAMDGKDKSSNPYDDMSVMHTYWNVGFREGTRRKAA